MMNQTIADNLRQQLNKPIPALAETALLIAQIEYPKIDIPRYLNDLDQLALQVREQLPLYPTLTEKVATLNKVLFQQQNFRGNIMNYYDPRNSFLNEVLDRREGIPITLSILYMEIGQRIDLPLEGISFPGHFLVKLPLEEGTVVLDPFRAGISLGSESLLKQLEEVYGIANTDLLQELLISATPAEIILRLLRNLKIIYLKNKQLSKVLPILDRILAINPDLPDELHERGMVYYELECFQAALHDLQQFIKHNPQHHEIQGLCQLLVELRQKIRHVH